MQSEKSLTFNTRVAANPNGTDTVWVNSASPFSLMFNSRSLETGLVVWPGSGAPTFTTATSQVWWIGQINSSGGTATFNVTYEGTAGGTAIFSSLSGAMMIASAERAGGGATSGPFASIDTRAANNKTVTVDVWNGSTVILAANALNSGDNNCKVTLLIIGL